MACEATVGLFGPLVIFHCSSKHYFITTSIWSPEKTPNNETAALSGRHTPFQPRRSRKSAFSQESLRAPLWLHTRLHFGFYVRQTPAGKAHTETQTQKHTHRNTHAETQTQKHTQTHAYTHIPQCQRGEPAGGHRTNQAGQIRNGGRWMIGWQLDNGWMAVGWMNDCWMGG